MLNSEKRSLIRFLLIYLVSTFVLFALASWIFYTFTKHHLLDQQREVLTYEAGKIKSQLRILHQMDASKLPYPKIEEIDSAIYDLDKRYIFGTYTTIPDLDQPVLGKNFMSHIEKIEPYYLGAAYLLVSKKIDNHPIEKLQKNIFLFMLGGGIFFTILGYFLGKLFIAPMRDSIKHMNRFIQDTTHELNTPISTILTNIEMLEALERCEGGKEELQRISIASQTLSRIYDDLTYLNLNHDYHRHITEVNMSKLLHERIAYFGTMAKAKNLRLQTKIVSNVYLQIDKNDALRLIDNLISNAIKYNKIEGMLKIYLDNEVFIVSDSGIGIGNQDLKQITERFRRANKSEGGFGIGLDIVNQVINYYGYILEIDSQIEQGTEVRIKWGK
jgi:two-component system OmpR family sensor kinase